MPIKIYDENQRKILMIKLIQKFVFIKRKQKCFSIGGLDIFISILEVTEV